MPLEEVSKLVGHEKHQDNGTPSLEMDERQAGPARQSRHCYVAQQEIAGRGYDIWSMVPSSKLGFNCGGVFFLSGAVLGLGVRAEN